MESLQTQNNPQSLLTQALEKGASIDTLEKLMALQERWQANEARKSFFDALSKFQQKCPVMIKDKKVVHNGSLRYKYVTLSSIAESIKGLLAECGLTYRWEIKDDQGKLQVTCIVTHREGHSENTTMSADADDSGGKNKIQSRGSAISYLERYTLVGALGISSADEDTDANVPQRTVDELHKEYMSMLNPLIQKDNTWKKFDPDNWKGERTSANYIKAIADLKEKSRGILR